MFSVYVYVTCVRVLFINHDDCPHGRPYPVPADLPGEVGGVQCAFLPVGFLSVVARPADDKYCVMPVLLCGYRQLTVPRADWDLGPGCAAGNRSKCQL